MIIKFGDKPIEQFKESLPEYENSDWFAEQKLDGWRCMCVKDTYRKTIQPFGSPDWAVGKEHDLFFLSRRGMQKGGPTVIPVSPSIIERIESLNLPDQTMLDCEWMSRRTIGECPETLYPFDILWFNNEWMGDNPAIQRFEQLQKIMDKMIGSVQLPSVAYKGVQQFFDEQTKIPYTEGIVLKHKQGKIKGSSREAIENGLLVKIKWRSGDTGRETFNL